MHQRMKSASNDITSDCLDDITTLAVSHMLAIHTILNNS